MFALLSVWIALGALLTTVVMALTHWSGREAVITVLPYTFALSVTFAAGVLWAYRGREASDAGVAGQRLQAIAAIAINTVALAILLIFVNGALYGPLGLAIEIVFLWICYWGYTRVVRPK